MNIHDGARIILKYMLDQVLSIGSLEDGFYIRYDELSNLLNLENENYCHICCQYLEQRACIQIARNDDGARFVYLTAKGIDYLEGA